MNFDLTLGLKWYLVFLFSTSLHEAAHAWTANRLGDSTAKDEGLVSLDPTIHIRRSPIGMAAVPLISFLLSGWMIGWASIPFRISWALEHPRRAAAMAFAGPAANLGLVVASGLGMIAGCRTHYFEPGSMSGWLHLVEGSGGMSDFFASMLSLAFMLNSLLFAFNLLPVPPLDGAKLPLAILAGPAAAAYFEFIHQPSVAYAGMAIAWYASSAFLPSLMRLAAQALAQFLHS